MEHPTPRGSKNYLDMKIATTSLAALLAVTITCQSQAATLTIASPNQGQTRSDSSIISRGLHWKTTQQRLTAVITFSNVDYVLQADPRETDTFAFALPGVRYDDAKNVFYTISKNGQRTPIAEFRRVLFGQEIELLPSATIYAENDHGNVTVRLLVNGATPASRWILIR
jgi:hypothetical protein